MSPAAGGATPAPSPDDVLLSETRAAFRRLLPGGVGTLLRVDVAALRANARTIRANIGSRFLWAVVKANAYGLGVVEVARHLEDLVDGFAVARIEEARQVRAVSTRPILVLGPLPRTEELPDDPELHLSVTSEAELARALADPGPWPLHLKVDTGMGRLGLDPARLATWLPQARRLGRRWHGLWSHLARAEHPGHPETRAARARFAALCRRLATEGIDPPQRHLANSAGLVGLGEHETAVRVGLYLYGGPPWHPAAAVALPAPTPVVAWVGPLAATHRVTAEAAVGYGATYRAAGAEGLGLLGCGYADGLTAHHQGLAVWCAGARRPVRGRVSMDLLSFALPEPTPALGTPVWLLGPPGAPEALTLRELAMATGRIPYEVLTAIGPRVVRWYVD